MNDNQPQTPDSIRADRDLTREELGQTVSELVAKADIQARAQDKVRETTDAARRRTAAAARQVADTAHHARQEAARLADKATPAVGEPLQDVGKQVTEATRRNRVPVIAVTAGSAAVVTWILLRRRRS